MGLKVVVKSEREVEKLSSEDGSFRELFQCVNIPVNMSVGGDFGI